MSQLKAKTLMQKVGFLDPDKKTPLHDKMQKWVYYNFEKSIEQIVPLNFEYKIVKKEWEYKLETELTKYQRVSSIVGFVDLKVTIELMETKKYISFYFEIKTEIPSLGELIRQLRFYEKYIPQYTENKNLVIVVSPNDEHKEILNEQGFHFYKYKDEYKLF
jgi:hypothetical protein